MDPFTHGIVGAAAGICVAKSKELRPAAAVAFLTALFPDADVFINSSADPLIGLEAHRGLTHSLIFTPLFGLLTAAVAWPFVNRIISLRSLLLAASVGALSAAVLDTCTSYGTSLFWPLSDRRVSLNLIAIVDPIFTTGVLAAFCMAYFRKCRAWAICAICVGGTYLGFGWMQHERVDYIAQVIASDRGHQIERLAVKPTLGNILLWRTVYRSEGTYYVDAVRAGIFSEVKIYEGESAPALTANMLPLPKNSVQRQDIRRFNMLTDGYTIYHPTDPFVVGDIRFSMMPDSAHPLWGVRLQPDTPEHHVSLETFREISSPMVYRFVSMLLGRPLGYSG